MARRTLKDLLPNTPHAIQVRSVGANGQKSEWSVKFRFTTTGDGGILKAPENVTWAAVGRAFKAEWDAVTKNIDESPGYPAQYELRFRDPSVPAFSQAFVAAGNPEERHSFTLTFEDNIARFNRPVGELQFRIRAVDAKGNASAWTDFITASSNKPDAPTPPENGPVATGGLNTIILNWTPSTSTGVTEHRVYVGTEPDFEITPLKMIWSGDGSSFSYTTTTYAEQYFKIVAANAFGVLSDPLLGQATPTSPFVVDNTPPGAPTDFAATLTNFENGQGVKIEFSWTNPDDDDFAGNELSYKPSSETSWHRFTVGPDDTTAQAEGRFPYVDYDLRIRAADRDANYSDWVYLYNQLPEANVAPATPTAFFGEPGLLDIAYRWEPVADKDLKFYNLQVSTSSDFTTGVVDYYPKENQMTAGGLSLDTTYYARIRSIDQGDLTSAWSPVETDTTGQFPVTATSDGNAPSTSPVATLTSGYGFLSASWDAVPNDDLVNYRLYLGTVAEYTPNNDNYILSTTSTNANILVDGSGTPLNYGDTYYVRIIAEDVDGLAAPGAVSNGAKPTLGADQAVVDKSVRTVIAEYSVNTSETVAPTSGWSTNQPTRSPGQFIWYRVRTTLNDGTSEVSAPAILTGNSGVDGTDGTDGVGIVSSTVTYQTHTSGTTAPTGTWSANPTATSPGQFLWTRTVTNYSDSTQTTAYAVAKHGDTGTAGRGITATAVTYQKSTNGTTAPTGTWSSTIPATNPGEYLWTRTVTSFSSAPTSVISYAVAKHGDTGATGQNGRGISSTVVTYQTSSSGTTAPTGTWVSSPPATTPGQYLWTRTVTTYTDGTDTTSYAVGKHGETGNKGDQGDPGSDGLDGVGVSNTSVTYQTGTSGTIAPTGTWSNSPTATSTGQFLWTRTVINYTDSTSSTVYSVAAHGTPGTNGTNGRSLTGTVVTYQASSSGTSAPTGTWTSTIPSVPQGQYLWTRTETQYSSAPTSVFSYAVARQGSDGAAGVSVTSFTPYFQTVNTGAAAPAKPTASPPPSPWTPTEPGYIAGKQLYRTERLLFSNGTFVYTDVTRVTSYDIAVQALESAQSGGNVVIYSLDAPTGTASDGDIWYRRDANNFIIGQWVWDAGEWKSVALSDAVLASLTVGKLTSGNITATDIVLSESGAIRSQNYSENTAGWKLGNNGLEVNSGSVKASALTTGSVTSAIISIAQGGILKTSNDAVQITDTGIRVTAAASGGISASTLTTGTFGSSEALTVNGNMTINGNTTIQNSGYIQSANYNATNKTGYRLSQAGLVLYGSGSAVYADALIGGTISSAGDINVGANSHIVLNGGSIRSADGSFSAGSSGIFVSSNGSINAGALTTGNITGATLTLGLNGFIQSSNFSSSSGFRLSSSGLTIPDGSISASSLNITSTFANDVVAGTTTIDGAKITTGTIQSSSEDNISGVSRRRWFLNKSGYAYFTSAQIFGNTIIGGSASDSTSRIVSSNFLAGNRGWEIKGDGNAEFNDIKVRGNITAQSGSTFTSGTINSSTINGSSLYLGSGAARMEVTTLGAGGLINFPGLGAATGSFINPGDIAVSGIVGSGNLGSGARPYIAINAGTHNNFFPGTTLRVFGGNSSGPGVVEIANGPLFVKNNAIEAASVWVNNTYVARGQSRSNASPAPVSGSYADNDYAYLDVNGWLKRSGNTVGAFRQSSRRFKQNIEALDVAASDILSIEPVHYEYLDEMQEMPGFAGKQLGLIAEDVAESDIPYKEALVQRDDEGQVRGLNYQGWTILLHSVARQQRETIEQQSEKIKSLEDKYDNLLERLEALERRA